MNVNYQKLNIILGWVCFAIAAFVYGSTIEPTTSFWDCGEYIATAINLEVGHPPGAPLFLLIGRFFSLFTFGDMTQGAKMINLMNGLCSAFTILFLFWTITAFARKILKPKAWDDNFTSGESLAILGSGLVGALAYTFTDSFWFSAVEGEVYAMSSFFTAIVFWAILRWERVADEPGSDRWLILIAYLMGLSIGVHLLNLLAIPAIVFIYYFRKYKPTTKGIVIAGILSIVILGAVQSVIIPKVVWLAAQFELFFVNTLGLPFNSGTIFYFAALIFGIVWGIRYTIRHNKQVWNTAILALTVLLIGYSSFFVLVVRSLANPPMDQNNPENAISLLSYLNREQYGDWPILKGPYYSAPVIGMEDGNPVYGKDEKQGKYVVINDKKESERVYLEELTTVFPRMYSEDESHIAGYKAWGKIKGKTIRVGDQSFEKPTFGENLRYFKDYQVGYMYLRYFMWNFAGRQNDNQGRNASLIDGNWISGISFIDDARLGPQDKLPAHVKNNNARNVYYCLPLILGLIGLVYHYRKHNRDFMVVLLLFFFTGLAIVIYLNQKPLEPRERDYAYAASFYAFAIWIGLGVLAIFDALRKNQSVNKDATTATSGKNEKGLAIAITTVLLVLVPGIMATQNWDDHDRSNRYGARDMAKNYLESCEKNAILFTHGDNDTFPLWYAQEVEGIRRDVRVIVLSYFNIDWYINQMKRRVYESAPVPISIAYEKYMQNNRDYLPFNRSADTAYHHIDKVMAHALSDDYKTMRQITETKFINTMFTNRIFIPVDKQRVLATNTVSAKYADRIEDTIFFKLPGSYLSKASLMILDIIRTNNWERPVYFGVTGPSEAYMGLEDYFQLEGLAFRLVPVKMNAAEEIPFSRSRVETDIMLKRMQKFAYGNLKHPGVHVDETMHNSFVTNMRVQLATLGYALAKEGKMKEAKSVLDKLMSEFPETNVQHNEVSFYIAWAYYMAGDTQSGNALLRKLFNMYYDETMYYRAVMRKNRGQADSQMQRTENLLGQFTMLARQFGQKELLQEFNQKVQGI